MAHDPTEHESQEHPKSIVHFLEKGDGLAHVSVACLLLLLAIGILFFSTYGFVKDTINHPEPRLFPVAGLEYLSEILLGVIVLELLSTILTYIQARNLEATIKDFLIVALISSIRKILMVGAQSSLHESTAAEFQAEAIGTVISIVGILLLIGGLIMLDWRMKSVRRDALGIESSGGGLGGLVKGVLHGQDESQSES